MWREQESSKMTICTTREWKGLLVGSPYKQLDSKPQNLIRLLRHLRLDTPNILDRQRCQPHRPLPFLGLNIRYLSSVRESRFSARSAAATGEVGRRSTCLESRALLGNVLLRGSASGSVSCVVCLRSFGKDLRHCSGSRARTGCRTHKRQRSPCFPSPYRGWYPRSRTLYTHRRNRLHPASRKGDANYKTYHNLRDRP